MGHSTFISCKSLWCSDINTPSEKFETHLPQIQIAFKSQENWSAPHPPPATPLRSSAYTDYRQSAASTNHAPSGAPLFHKPIKSARPPNHDRGLINDTPSWRSQLSRIGKISRKTNQLCQYLKKACHPRRDRRTFLKHKSGFKRMRGRCENDIHELIHVVISPFSNLNLDWPMLQFID